MQSVGAASAVSLAIGHNPGQVDTLTQDTSMLALILPPRKDDRQSQPHLVLIQHPSIHPLEPYSVQSVGAASAVSLAIGHNPGWVDTLTQDTSMVALNLPTSEG